MPIQMNHATSSLSQPYRLANDSEMRLLLGYSVPPRAGKVQSVSSGVYIVEIADGEDSTVRAVALNGFVYNVGALVYVLQASNAPDSGVIVGSRSSAAELAVGAGSPDGPLHAEDDVGAFVVVSAAHVGASEQTLISSRISKAVIGDVMAVVDGSSAALALSLGVPGSAYNAQNLAIASNTLQFRLYSTGELRVVRTAGTGTPDVLVRALWM